MSELHSICKGWLGGMGASYDRVGSVLLDGWMDGWMDDDRDKLKKSGKK